MMDSKMTFAVDPAMQGATWEDLVTVWRRVEEIGFTSAWVSDHLMAVSAPDPAAPYFEAWTVQAALAAATTRIRVGCLVTGNTYRHPAVLAKMAATVDHVSGGRLIFGIGSGWSQEDHDPYGIPFFTFKERQERLSESLEVITRLWSEERANFQGVHYQLTDAVGSPKPVQQPRPPIMIGGTGERTLRTVAAWADMWNAAGSPAMLRERMEVLDRHCKEVGRDPAAIERSVLISAIFADDPARKEAILDRRRSSYSPARGQLAGRYVMMSDDEATNAILLGTSDHMIEGLRRFQEAGVRHIILTVPYPANYRALERFASEVIPAFA